MSPQLEPRQSVFRRSRALLGLGLAGFAAAGAAVWFVAGPPPVPFSATSGLVPPPERAPGVALAYAPEAVPMIELVAAPSTPKLPATQPRDAGPPTSLATLERRFHATRVTEDRIAILREIAGQNDAAAVVTLGRIFPLERHPAIKEALLASLNDIDHDEALDARLALLTTALRGQPREVRSTALDSLAQLDDPRVASLLKKSMQEDPDHEVRDLAAALYQATLDARVR